MSVPPRRQRGPRAVIKDIFVLNMMIKMIFAVTEARPQL